MHWLLIDVVPETKLKMDLLYFELFWPSYTDMALKGTFNSPDHVHWSLYVYKIYNGWEGCMDYDKFIYHLNFLEVAIVFFNPYIDYQNIDDPFRIEMNELHRVNLTPEYITEYKIFIKENTYSIDNNYLYETQSTGKYYNADSGFLNLREYDNRYTFGIITFWMSSKTTHYEIRVYSLMDVISTIGGIFGICTLLCSVFFSYVANKSYQFFLIKKLSKTEEKLRRKYLQEKKLSKYDAKSCMKEEFKLIKESASKINHKASYK